jgi:hypothetical protein
MIFNEKWGKGIYPLPRPWHFNQNQWEVFSKILWTFWEKCANINLS